MAERFEGTLEQHGSGTLLEVPFDVRTVFGKARAPVRGTLELDDEPRTPWRCRRSSKLRSQPTNGPWTAFAGLSYTHRREYVEWVSGAKREETRRARLERAVGMLRDGVRHPSDGCYRAVCA